ncbi:hypothetical protein [Vallitalea sp.]|uniref:hypothetical protein n=1 Tax=Vallitalea sp. TaxID=1882829 RepID=UPI0025D7F67B|nr:hypothetical protein [Vallitalea sp.]MCT4688521.1 hypothetical protein [Vallitalea sp.]
MGKNGSWGIRNKDDGRTEGVVKLNTDLNSNVNDVAEGYESAKINYKYGKTSKEDIRRAKAKYEANRAGTIVHEFVIHGINDMIRVKKGQTQIYNSYKEHVTARKSGSFFREVGLPAIYHIHKILKTGEPKRTIVNNSFKYKN